MRITIDTATDSLDEALATVRAAYGAPAPTEAKAVEKQTSEGSEGDHFPGNWTTKRLKTFATYLAEDAAEAVRYIAAEAPSVSMDDVIAHMGKHLGIKDFSGQALGGRMASVGFASNAISGVKGAPYDTDYRHRRYRIDERIAKVLLEALNERFAS